jgi:hypothetical protein
MKGWVGLCEGEWRDTSMVEEVRISESCFL